MHRIWLTVFGAGYSPFIPGTCGSAVVAGVFLAAAWWGARDLWLAGIMLAVAVHGFVVTILYADRLIQKYGPDPRQIVSDEQCGQAVTYLGLWSFTHDAKDILILTIIGFVLFRIFDILKPPPARNLEKIKGGWGVVLDDVMAGIYANILLQIFWYFIW